MARAYTLNIAADTRAVKVGIDKGVIEPLEDALEVLEDIGRDGGRELDKLEDAARDAQQSTEKVGREFSDLAKEIRETGRRAKTDFGDKMKDASDTATEGVTDFKQEAAQTAAETAASFDGSAESITGAFQEVAANAFAGFGPAGAVAGIAAAAGIGLVGAALEEQDRKAQESAELISEMYDKMLESGTTYLTSLDKVSFIDAVLGNEEDRKKAQEAADRIGVTLTDYLMAQFDIGGKREQVEKSIRDLYQEQAEQMERPGPGMEERALAAAGIRDREREALEELLKYDSAQQEAAELAAVREAAVKEVGATEREQIQRTRDADRARYEAAASRYGQPLPTAVVPVTADTGAADRAIRNFIQTPRRLRIDIEGRTANGQRVI